jgi:hypothetical protein
VPAATSLDVKLEVATRVIGVATATSSGESYSRAGREGRGGDYIAKTYRDRS